MLFLENISNFSAKAANVSNQPLTLPSGSEPESIEQLRENADKAWLVGAFRSGALGKWLDEMCYEAEARKVGEISDKAADELFSELSDAIGLPKPSRESAVQKLSEYTKNPELLKLAENAAYSQKELVGLLNGGAKTVVLVKGNFRLTREFAGVTYHVVEGAKFELPCSVEELAEKHIFICNGSGSSETLELITDFSIDAYQPYVFLKERIGRHWKSFDSERETQEKLHSFAEKAYREARNIFNTGSSSCILRELSEYYDEQLGKALEKHSEKLRKMCADKNAGIFEQLELLCK